MNVGRYVFGLAVAATGVIDVAWGAFDPAEQPIQAFGDHIPGAHVLAYVVGLGLIASGALVLDRRTVRIGAWVSAIAYAVFAVFNFPRFVSGPLYLGQHVSVYLGVLTGVCQDVIAICAAAILYTYSTGNASSFVRTAIRWAYGCSAIVFGCNHLASLRGGAPFVPAWMPLGSAFWVALTGIAFVLAGIAIISTKADVLAAKLLAVMLLAFSCVTLVPFLVANPKMEGNWGANAYNIVAVASAWLLAEWTSLLASATSRET